MNSVENCPFCTTVPCYEMVQGLNGQPATHKIVCPHCGVTIKGKSKEEVFEKWNMCGQKDREDEHYYNSLVASLKREYDKIPIYEQCNYVVEFSPYDFTTLRKGRLINNVIGMKSVFGIDAEINQSFQKGEYRIARKFKVPAEHHDDLPNIIVCPKWSVD